MHDSILVSRSMRLWRLCKALFNIESALQTTLAVRDLVKLCIETERCLCISLFNHSCHAISDSGWPFFYLRFPWLFPDFSLNSENLLWLLDVVFWQKLWSLSRTWGVIELLSWDNMSKFHDFSLTFLFLFSNSLTFPWFPGKWPSCNSWLFYVEKDIVNTLETNTQLCLSSVISEKSLNKLDVKLDKKLTKLYLIMFLVLTGNPNTQSVTKKER